MTPDQALQLAMQHHSAGRLAEAEQIYRRILQQNPNHADALFSLGTLAGQMNQFPLAISLIENAVTIQPANHTYHANLGEFYRRLKQFDRAILSLRRAIELCPTDALSFSNLALVLIATRHFDQAIEACTHALRLQPDSPEILNNLAAALQEKGDLFRAIETWRRAIALQPRLAHIHYNLGLALNLASLLDQAIVAFQQAIALKPDYHEAYSDLAAAFIVTQHLDEAAAACQRALQIKPDFAAALNNLGSLFAARGQITPAISAFRGAARPPASSVMHSNLVYHLQFSPDYDAPAILRELKLWNETHAAPLARDIQPPLHPGSSPDKRLKIGYVSPDFRNHALGRYILPLLREHDHAQFEIFCYANHFADDEMTNRIRGYVDHWRHITPLDDQRVAHLIRQDGIDILVDLSLHMADNRLPLFARKPAPIQVTFGAYPGSTGLETMDYRLTDPYLDPEGADEYYIEKSIRLPHSFWCYDSEGMSLDQSPEVNPLPAQTCGFITFGCLNQLCKVNDTTLALWRQVLDAVPNSRILLLSPPGSHCRPISEKLAHRVNFLPFRPRNQYLAAYHQIDLGLDTIPYNGHTTSLDALWMGVPVVTLVGQTAVGRAGWSQLSNLNLTELAARTPQQFVEIASTLAADLPRLAALRSSLHDRMKSSPLMDAPRFARGIESVYRQMWITWINR